MFEAYKIGVRVTVIDEFTRSMAKLLSYFQQSETAATKLHTRLTAIKGFFAGGLGLMGAGAALAAPLVYATDKAAELQKQMIAIRIATRGTTDQMNSMRQAIEGVASQTMFSNIDVAKMAKQVATGTGLGAQQVQSILPAYVKYADVQLLMKGTPYEQSVRDAIMAAHGAQHYDPKSLTTYLDTINKASLFIPGSTHEIARALAYSQGITKQALGSDDEQNILLVALMNRMGFPGTRGGTNVSAAMTRSIPGVFGSGLLKGKSYQALAAMNMIDAQGHAKVFTDGKFDTMKWTGLMSDYVAREFASHPEAIARQDIMTNFQHAYGTIGSRAAALLSSPQAIEQFRTMHEQMEQFGGFEGMQQIFKDESVAQQYQNAMTNLQSAMVELGLTLLPTVTKALVKFNGYMSELIDWMTKNPGQVKQYAKDVAYFSAALLGLGAVSVATSAVIGLATSIGYLKNAAAAIYGAAGVGSAKGLLGGAASLGGAAALGYGLGTLAYDHWIQGTSFDENSGRQVAKIMALFGSQTAKDALAANRDYVRPGAARGTVDRAGDVYIDGQKAGTILSKHILGDPNAPQTGISSFDYRMHMMPAGGIGY
jgi:hypothetical protein